MKIEKISNSQIRCILTGEDLASRQLRLSELAYGSEKARALFRDMMEQAAIQCGFDAENYPLMIEAIPLGSDSIVLIVTKVDNPEELDTRFSNFAPSVQKDAAPAKEPPSPLSQLLKSMKENTSDESGSVRTPESRKSAEEALKERREQLLTSTGFFIEYYDIAKNDFEMCCNCFYYLADTLKLYGDKDRSDALMDRLTGLMKIDADS